MKKVAFLTSHLYSGSTILYEILRQNSRVAGYRLANIYNHPLSIEMLTDQPHYDSTSAAVWLTELNFNYSFCCAALYKICKFIYVIREPEPTLNLLSKDMKLEYATRYYCYRLRRICEMAKRTPGAIMLTWDDLVTGDGLLLIQKYLNLKKPLANLPLYEQFKPTKSTNLGKWLAVAEDSYERHLFFLKNQNLTIKK